ncbi:MAG: hypothetical protein ACE5E5_08155 [Phycisphaerae bacterium]
MSAETQGPLNASWPGSTVSWKSLDQIHEPGAYVSRSGGDLIRVPASGGSVGDAELMGKHGEEPVFVARISSDPFLPISSARMMAANLDIEIGF